MSFPNLCAHPGCNTPRTSGVYCELHRETEEKDPTVTANWIHVPAAADRVAVKAVKAEKPAGIDPVALRVTTALVVGKAVGEAVIASLAAELGAELSVEDWARVVAEYIATNADDREPGLVLDLGELDLGRVDLTVEPFFGGRGPWTPLCQGVGTYSGPNGPYPCFPPGSPEGKV